MTTSLLIKIFKNECLYSQAPMIKNVYVVWAIYNNFSLHVPGGVPLKVLPIINTYED